MPPISVVTTSASVGISGRKSSKSNTPTILMKPQAKQNSAPTITIAARPNNSNSPGLSTPVNNSPSNATPKKQDSSSALGVTQNDMSVDSALLSALRDKRERMALLRLEKNLIQFMNDKNCGFMEVGGAGNSTVKRGASGGSGSGVNSPDGENDICGGKVQMNAMNGYNGNDGVVGRQTSFQRLCLHRLADRFNIVREQAYNNPNNYANNSNPGLIRLVKVKDSQIPAVKLIDLDLTQYDQTLPQDRGEGFTPGVMGITDRLVGVQIKDGNGGKKLKKKEKVKIMKRSSSNNLAGNEQKGKLNASKRKGKKLSDKEKAYAEARARIFNSAESSPNASATDLSDNVAGSNHSAENGDHNDCSPRSTDGRSTTSPVPPSGKSSSPLNESQPLTLVPAQLSSSNTYKEWKPNRSNLPAAATGGGTSKVTWRNREQEASDPDFQRRHHPAMLQPMPMHPQYHLYAQQTAMMTNGYGQHTHSNPSAYHYGDGQLYNNVQNDSGIGMYATTHQFHGSWNSYESQPPHKHHIPQNNDHSPPHKVDMSQTLPKSSQIDLNGEEFPALR